MVKVDILLPYWGDFSLFVQTVQSVQAQTVSNWRLLIFDDCYPGTTAKNYITQLKDSRISYVRHKANIGVTANFNYALQNAQSAYCVFLGCDDILLPEYIENALRKIGTADFYQPSVGIINGMGQNSKTLTDAVKRFITPNKPGYYSGKKLAASLCLGNWLYFPSILWKTDTIKKYTFDSSLKVVQDVDVELGYIRDGAVLYLDNKKTFLYRRHDLSLSSQEKNRQGTRFEEEAIVYDKYAKIFSTMGWGYASLLARLQILSRINRVLNHYK